MLRSLVLSLIAFGLAPAAARAQSPARWRAAVRLQRDLWTGQQRDHVQRFLDGTWPAALPTTAVPRRSHRTRVQEPLPSAFLPPAAAPAALPPVTVSEAQIQHAAAEVFAAAWAMGRRVHMP